MSNIQRLAADGNKNHKLFAATIIDLMHSQGFYERLYKAVNEMSEEAYSTLFRELDRQSFNDCVDVILWLES